MSVMLKALRRFMGAISHDMLDHGPERGGAISYSFINSSHVDIIVTNRNNEAMLVERADHGADTSKPGLTIKISRSFNSRKSSTSVSTLTNSIAAMMGFMNEHHKDTLTVLGKTTLTQSGTMSITRRIFVPIKDIVNDRSLFEVHSGLLLSVDGSHLDHLHPDSVEFRMANQNTSFVVNQPVGRLFEIVDNFRSHKERFVYVGNGVLKVSYTVDPERADGLYVTEVESKGGAVSSSRTERYEFEEGFKKFGLFLTREEAETNGNPGVLHERTIEDLRRENALLTQRNALDTANNRREENSLQQLQSEHERTLKNRELAFQREMDVLLAEQRTITAKMKEELERDKQRQEAASSAYSTNLKTTSDTLKFVPAIIAGVATIIGGLLFFRK